MPHLVFSSLPKITYPFIEAGYCFKGHFEQNPHHALIWVQYQGKNFFLRQQQKQDQVLLKCDKQTRPSPIGIIKNALGVYKHRFKETLIHDNLSDNTIRQKENSPFLITPQELEGILKQASCIELEIGFGSGRRIIDEAKKQPSKLFIGVEIHGPSIEQVLRQIKLQNLNNLYILACDARILLESLPNHCLDSIIVHFPIPWKKPHRRIFNAPFITQAQRVIKAQGKVHLRSDDEAYFKDSLDLILQSPTNHCEIFKNHHTSISSKYEDRWHRQNKNIFDLFWHISQTPTPQATSHPFDFTPSDVHHLREALRDTQSYKRLSPTALLSIKAVYAPTQETYDEVCIVSLCMGSLAYPQNTHLILDAHEAFYCPKLMDITANHEAHEWLKQYHTLKQEATCTTM